MNVTLMERQGFQLFFNVITIAIDALWHFSYTIVIELSYHVAQVVLDLVFLFT